MPNLKGGTFDKQVRSAFYRVLNLGEGRHMENDMILKNTWKKTAL